MTNLEIAKEIITKYGKKAQCGIFDCRNTAGDIMFTIYSKNGLIIDICYDWEYFEVFGLSEEDFSQLEKYYYNNICYLAILK